MAPTRHWLTSMAEQVAEVRGADLVQNLWEQGCAPPEAVSNLGLLVS